MQHYAVVVISWIFTTFTGSTTTHTKKNTHLMLLWLAEFLLPLQGQQQQPWTLDCLQSVVISWIFTTFTGSTTTCNAELSWVRIVVISWIFTTFTGSTTTDGFIGFSFDMLWLAEFLLPLQGQQQLMVATLLVMMCCD